MAYNLSPVCNDQQLSAAGAPLSGGFIYTYLAGSATPATTYADNAGTAQTNPIVLNTLGFPTLGPIWLQSGRSYKLVVKDSSGVTQKTFDNVVGVNDVSSVGQEWNQYTNTATYISSTSFSVAGDQTGTLHVGRRVKTTNTGGTVYSTITSAVYSASITTVTVRNDSGTLDSGLSAVYYSIIDSVNPSLPNAQAVRQAMGLGYGADIASAGTIDLTARTGQIVRITGTVATSIVTLNNGDQVWCYAVGAWPLTYDATNLPLPGNGAITSYTCSPGDIVKFTKNGSGTISVEIYKKDGTPLITQSTIRQTVLSGVTSSGFPAFLSAGSGLSVSLSATASPLVLTTANGFNASGGAVDTVTTISSDVASAWASLTASTTLYLYVDSTSPSAPTYGFSSLQPVYQSTAPTSPATDQHWFDTTAVQMKRYNGSAWVFVPRNFVGECVTGASTVTSVTSYAFRGKYDSGWINTTPGTAVAVSKSSNLGRPSDSTFVLKVKCLTAEGNYSVGDVVNNVFVNSGALLAPVSIAETNNTVSFITGNNTGFQLLNKTTGAAFALTPANWAYRITN